MIKDTLFQGETDRAHVLPLDMMDYTMLKSAAQDLHPEIARYIQNVRPIPGKNVLLIDALGAGEIWGDNVNGDYFPRSELIRDEADAGYRSFMNHAYPYKHHQNEATKVDPSRRFGERVPLSVYHKPMDRVQLIVIVDGQRAGDIVSQCDKGMYPDVSMACGVPYDQCSICGSIHRTRADYCNHATKMLRHIMPDGQKVYLKNYRPRFHDISFVMIGAEKQAKVLMKIAQVSHQIPVLSSGQDLTQLMMGISPGVVKEADIDKEIYLNRPKVEKVANEFISAKEAGDYLRGMLDLQDKEASMEPRLLELLSGFEIQNIVKTAHILGMRIKPEELQYIALQQTGMAKEARGYHDSRVVFDQTKRENRSLPMGEYQEKIANVLSMALEERSSHRPFMALRLQKGAMQGMQKQAASISSLVWPALSGVFSSFKMGIPGELASVIKMGATAISPYVTPAATVAAYGMAYDLGQQVGGEIRDSQDRWNDFNMTDDQFMNSASYGEYGKEGSVAGRATGVGSVPLIYLYADHVKNRESDPVAWNNTGGVAKLIANNPGIMSFLSLLATPKVVDSLSMDRSLLKAVTK